MLLLFLESYKEFSQHVCYGYAIISCPEPWTCIFPALLHTNSHPRSQQEKARLASVGQFSQRWGLPWVMFILASDAAFRSNMSLLMYTLVRHAVPFINHQPANPISQGKMTSEVDKIAFITIKIAHTLNPNKLNT